MIRADGGTATQSGQRVFWILDGSYRRSMLARWEDLLTRYPGARMSVLACDAVAARLLTDYGIQHRTKADYVQLGSDVYRDESAGMRVIEAVERLVLPGGDTVRSLTVHSGICLWDLHRVELLLHGFGRLVGQVEYASRVLDIERPDRIVISGCSDGFVTLAGLRFDRVLLRAFRSLAAARSVPYVWDHSSLLSWVRLRAAAVSLALPLLSLAKTFAIRIRLRARGLSPPLVRATDVVALNHTARNAETIVPVVSKLEDSGRRETIVVQVGPQGEDYLGEGRVPYVRWEHYCTLRAAVATTVTTFRLFWNWYSLKRAVDKTEAYREAFRHGQSNLWDMLQDGLQFLWMTLPQGARNCEIARRVIEATQPQMLVGTNERSGTFRAFFEVGRLLRIPSLCVQFGTIDPNPMWLTPIATDVMAVEGSASIEALTGVGSVRCHTVVTGQPKYDVLLGQSLLEAREQVFEQFAIPASFQLVVYASHTQKEVRWKHGQTLGVEDTAYTAEIQGICEAVGALKDTFLIVKPHPNNDDPRLHRQIIDQLCLTNIALALQTSPFTPMLLACDLLVTRASLSGMDALVVGKPLVIINLSGEPDLLPFSQYGAAFGVDSVEDMKSTIDVALRSPTDARSLAEGRKKFLREYTYRQDRRATSRVVTVIDDILSGRSRPVPASERVGA